MLRSLRVDLGVEAREPEASVSEPPAPFILAGIEFRALRPFRRMEEPMAVRKEEFRAKNDEFWMNNH